MQPQYLLNFNGGEMNKVILMGRLGQAPELRYTQSGDAVCNFSVATNNKWTDENGKKQESTEWHRVVMFKKQAENCNQYLVSGSKVLVEGKLKTRQWEDKDGNKRYITEISANNVQFLDSPSESTQSENKPNNKPNQNYNVSTNANFAADDIPF